MKTVLLGKTKNFFKANLHMHTTISDGQMTPEEVKEAYRSNGYSIVAFTDHDVMVPHNDLTDKDFLAITSCEMEINQPNPENDFSLISTYHLNFFSKDPGAETLPCFSQRYVWLAHSKKYVTDEMRKTDYIREYSVECINDMISKANAAGFLVSYNHPVWSLQTRDDYAELKGLWGVECYNTGCARAGMTDNEQPFDDLLKKGNRIFPLATDDAHTRRDLFGGFAMVDAEKLEYAAVMRALEKGDFYSSTGPLILELCFEENQLSVRCSKAVKIVLNTDRRFALTIAAESGKTLEGGTFDLSEFLRGALAHDTTRYPFFFRVTVVDERGDKAWTRAYFEEDLRASL